MNKIETGNWRHREHFIIQTLMIPQLSGFDLLGFYLFKYN